MMEMVARHGGQTDDDFQEKRSANDSVKRVLRFVLSKALLGMQSEIVPNAYLHHLIVLIGLVLCICTGHESSTLGPNFSHFDAAVGFGGINLDVSTVVRDIEQRNLQQVVCIVPTLVGCLLVQTLLSKGASVSSLLKSQRASS